MADPIDQLQAAQEASMRWLLSSAGRNEDFQSVPLLIMATPALLAVARAAANLYVRDVPEKGYMLLSPSTYKELCEAQAALREAVQ